MCTEIWTQLLCSHFSTRNVGLINWMWHHARYVRYNIKTQKAVCDRHTHVQILEISNLLSRIYDKPHISAGVCRHNFVVCGREPIWEHLEYEWDSPKANVCCTLNYESHRPLCIGEDVNKNVFPTTVEELCSSASHQPRYPFTLTG
jgi:hypothetical protein